MIRELAPTRRELLKLEGTLAGEARRSTTAGRVDAERAAHRTSHSDRALHEIAAGPQR